MRWWQGGFDEVLAIDKLSNCAQHLWIDWHVLDRYNQCNGSKRLSWQREKGKSMHSIARMKTVLGISAVLVLISVSSAKSDSYQEGLDRISNFANKMCTDIPIIGQGANAKLNAEAKAELASMLKGLVDLGIEGAGSIDISSYENVLREDLVTALEDSRECKLKIWEDLKVKVLDQSSNVKTPEYKWKYAGFTANYKVEPTGCSLGPNPIKHLCTSETIGQVAVCYPNKNSEKCGGAFTPTCLYKPVLKTATMWINNPGNVHECVLE